MPPASRPPPPPRNIRREAESFLASLESQIVSAKKLTREAARDVASGAFQSYQRYREALASIGGVSALIKDRMESLPEEAEVLVRRRFNQAIGGLLVAEIHASLDIFLSLAQTKTLPLGSRELFEEELGHLLDKREAINSADYAEVMTPETREKLEQARSILEDIAARAPGLIAMSRARYAARRNAA